MGYMTSTLTQSLHPHAGACFEFPKHKMMDLDTTKTKQHKTFPSFTQLLPPPQPIILEIIFSSDDVSEGEQGEESDGDSSCDEDDEDSDVDGADLPTHNPNNHEEEDTEEEDDEEDEEEDNDAEDSEEDEGDDDSDADSDEEEESTIEYDEDIDPEEFESGYHDNDDLLVEFSHNDEDGLVVEFEDEEEEDDDDTPQAPVNPIPFWFSNEEEDQIRMVFKSYGLTLDIEKQRKACIRAPAPFVGKIRRTPLKPLDGAEKKFMTLDKVEIYIHELCPLGTILPLSRIIWLLTTWDSSEGIPTQSLELTKSMKNAESMQKRAQPNLSSTLYCAPVFMTKEEYKYSVSAQEVSLMYTSNSTTNASISRISPFLPEHCRTVSFSMD